MTLEEIRAATIALLREDYPVVKRAVTELEVFTRSRSKKAVYELRDFLDHIATIFRDEITPEKALANLGEAKTHLRRCTVEPIEYLAEKTLVYVMDSRDSWVMRIPFGGNPILKSGFTTRLLEAQELITKGREEKTTMAAYATFRKSYDIAKDLYAEVLPFQYWMRAIVWTLGIFAGLATIATAFIHAMRLWYYGL